MTQEQMTELRAKAETSLASPGDWFVGDELTEWGLQEEDAAFIAAANPIVVIGLLDGLAEAYAYCAESDESCRHLTAHTKALHWQAQLSQQAQIIAIMREALDIIADSPGWDDDTMARDALARVAELEGKTKA